MTPAKIIAELESLGVLVSSPGPDATSRTVHREGQGIDGRVDPRRLPAPCFSGLQYCRLIKGGSQVTDKPNQEVATLIAHPRAIRERLAHSLREADVLKRLLKAAEYAAERLKDQGKPEGSDA